MWSLCQYNTALLSFWFLICLFVLARHTFFSTWPRVSHYNNSIHTSTWYIQCLFYASSCANQIPCWKIDLFGHSFQTKFQWSKAKQSGWGKRPISIVFFSISLLINTTVACNCFMADIKWLSVRWNLLWSIWIWIAIAVSCYESLIDPFIGFNI